MLGLDSLFAIATIMGGVAILVTTKLQNLLKPKGKALNYGLAFAVSTGIVLGSKFAGAELGLPDVSSLSGINLVVLDVLVFAMAGGFWDMLKIIGIRKPK